METLPPSMVFCGGLSPPVWWLDISGSKGPWAWPWTPWSCFLFFFVLGMCRSRVNTGGSVKRSSKLAGEEGLPFVEMLESNQSRFRCGAPSLLAVPIKVYCLVSDCMWNPSSSSRPRLQRSDLPHGDLTRVARSVDVAQDDSDAEILERCWADLSFPHWLWIVPGFFP